ncbi:hypothetical protein [Paracoccus aerodenitrificans]|uniref:hypothetical protein n=1 Tax=Paracoccus aerodenitrificans TaxID=3017781 RepID=UPI0022EFE45D|nr:hypothetical protein [Paracoccus aerodenitrificans]WBU63815.1 hypothetical protein PAE61_16000 [Paracoccus aerodenitrificans]
MLSQAKAGRFNFANRIREAVEDCGWTVEFAAETDRIPDRRSYALHHMSGPSHSRVLLFRRTYYYPFWHIEKDPQRWRWPVAQTIFEPDQTDQAEAKQFIHKLRQRIMPDLSPGTPEHVLIPLQERLTEMRSFQTMSPLDMVETVAATGRRCIVTLHPKGDYSGKEKRALDALIRRYDNLCIGSNSRALLPGTSFVATQNSSVAFDAYLLARPVVLFGQIDFHHIALKVSDLGADEALQRAPHHKAYYAKYLLWFLRDQAIDASAPSAGDRIIEAMRKGGWPI